MLFTPERKNYTSPFNDNRTKFSIRCLLRCLRFFIQLIHHYKFIEYNQMKLFWFVVIDGLNDDMSRLSIIATNHID